MQGICLFAFIAKTCMYTDWPSGMSDTAEITTTSMQENALYARVTRRILPVLFVCYVIAYLDRVNVGFAKLDMLHDLGFSEAVYGLGAGIFFLGYCSAEVPSNIMLARFGARRW